MEETALTSFITAIVMYVLGIILTKLGIKPPAFTPTPPSTPATPAPVVGPLGLPAPDGKGSLAKAVLALLAKRFILGETLTADEAEAVQAIERVSAFSLAQSMPPKEVK